MQRVSSRALLLSFATIGALVASLLVVFMLMGSSSTPKAQAIVPTKTVVATATPKPANDQGGVLSGLFDACAGLVPVTGPCTFNPSPTDTVYACMVRIDENSTLVGGVNPLKSSLTCGSTGSLATGAGMPPTGLWHGPGPQGANPCTATVAGEGTCGPRTGYSAGPPYTGLAPYKLNGFYCPNPGPCAAPDGSSVPGDGTWAIGCLADFGTILGPNVVVKSTSTAAVAGNPGIGGSTTNLATVYTAATNLQCTNAQGGAWTASLLGNGTIPLITTLTRRATTRVYTGVGTCTDMDKLWQNKQGSATKCPQDPFNPYAVEGSSDVSGSWSLTAEAVRADVGAPGLYYNCDADIQQAVKVLTARILCVIDSPGITVNPQVAGAAEDPTLGQCGGSADDDSDGVVNDGCPTDSGGTPKESGGQCANNTDDDADGSVNDGCPAVAAPETGANCANNTDDDSDGAVNDGCPTVASEFGANCANATDDDGDTVVNDGCPAAGAPHTACLPAAAKFCGDGQVGAGPPGCSVAPCPVLAGQGAGCPTLPCDVSKYQFADIDNKQTVLTGAVDNTANAMNLSGCFISDAPEGDGFGSIGNVYIQAKINIHTGAGETAVYPFQARAACIAGTPVGGPLMAQIASVRQGPGPKMNVAPGAGVNTGCLQNGTPPGSAIGYANCRDGDGDGCPDKIELGDTAGGASGGGLRDPGNPFDYFNPEKANTPHGQTVADILKVVPLYGKNQGNALYTIDVDRTAISGGNVWNLGPPDGQVTVADILAAVKQYNQNC